MSIEALANIYLMSIKDTIDTLHELSEMHCDYEFVNNSKEIVEPVYSFEQVPYMLVNGFYVPS